MMKTKTTSPRIYSCFNDCFSVVKVRQAIKLVRSNTHLFLLLLLPAIISSCKKSTVTDSPSVMAASSTTSATSTPTVKTFSTNTYGPLTMYTPPSGSTTLYARATQLNYSGANNGKMYATFEVKQPNPAASARIFPVFESTDGGASWNHISDVTDQVNGWGMRFQPFLFELPQAIGNMPAGTLLCAGNSVPSSNSNTKIDIYKSNDLGRTWTFISSVATGGPPSIGGTPIWEPFLMVANGKLICFYSDERDPNNNQKLVHETSTDGLSWSSPVDDVALGTTLRPGMATVAKMANGQYIMFYEVAGQSPVTNNYKISSNPESWNPSNAGTTVNSGGSPYVVALPSGRLIMDTFGSGNIFTNTTNGTGSWTAVSTPFGNTNAYSRCLVPTQDGNLFIISGGPFPATSSNTVTYANMPIGNYCKFINRANGMAIDNLGVYSNGSNVVQNTAQPTYNQHWLVTNIGQGYIKLSGRTGGSFLDNLNRNTNGSILGQYQSGPSQNQQWQFSYTGGYVKITNRANGLCIDNGGQTATSAPMQMWANGSSTNQQWTIIPVD